MAPPKLRVAAMSLALVGAASLTVITASPAQSAEAAALPVSVSISKSRIITMPTTIAPGVNQFAITTRAKVSAFQLARPAAGYTVREAVRDVRDGLEGEQIKALKRFEANVTLYGGVTATPDDPATLFVNLPAGTYWALDTHARPNKAEGYFTFTVTGPGTGVVAPTTAKVKAVASTKWSRKPASIPNKGLLTFKNRSDKNHFMVMVKLKKGKDFGDFKVWFKSLEGGPPAGPPPVNFDIGLDSGVNSPGIATTFNYKLPKGNYVLLCFWPDAEMGGMPHAFMGMYRPIKLR